MCIRDSSSIASWTGTISFGDLIDSSNTKRPGPYGWTENGMVKYAEKGDILQYYNYTPGDWDHSYVVCGVTGTYGARTFDNIFICAHTTDRLNTKLSDIWAYNDTNLAKFRTIRIRGVYTS